MGYEYILCYELKNDEKILFEFNESVDINKYNKLFLSMYGRKILKRYVILKSTNERISLKQYNEKYMEKNNGHITC